MTLSLFYVFTFYRTRNPATSGQNIKVHFITPRGDPMAFNLPPGVANSLPKSCRPRNIDSAPADDTFRIIVDNDIYQSVEYDLNQQ